MQNFIRTRYLAGALLTIGFCIFYAQAQTPTEKLGDIKYTPPKGWTKSAKDHAVAFGDLNPAEKEFGFITLYAASPSEGSPQKDFAREWNERVVKPWKGESSPKTETQPDDGWTVISGGAPIDFDGNKAVAILMVVSGFGKTVSILGIMNANAYLVPLQAFAESIDIDKTPLAAAATVGTDSTTSASVPGPPKLDDFGRIIITPPTRQLTIADLAGQWAEAASFHQRYVYRSSGNYAGSDSLTYKSKMTLTADGGFYNDFYAIQNGKLIKEKTGGAFGINGRILWIKQNNLAKYVIRGWLELPDMTVLEVCGPWYDGDVIPQEIFNNPLQGVNLNSQWVRKK